MMELFYVDIKSVKNLITQCVALVPLCADNDKQQLRPFNSRKVNIRLKLMSQFIIWA